MGLYYCHFYHLLIIWDSPGLGDGKEKDVSHSKNIISKLHEYDSEGNALVDLVLVLIDGSSRDLGTSGALIRDVLLPLMGKGRILYALNKCDMMAGGRHWEEAANSPDPVLLGQMSERAAAIAGRLSEDCGLDVISSPVCYSAMRGYNTEHLFSEIIRYVPGAMRRHQKQ